MSWLRAKKTFSDDHFRFIGRSRVPSLLLETDYWENRGLDYEKRKASRPEKRPRGHRPDLRGTHTTHNRSLKQQTKSMLEVSQLRQAWPHIVGKVPVRVGARTSNSSDNPGIDRKEPCWTDPRGGACEKCHVGEEEYLEMVDLHGRLL